MKSHFFSYLKDNNGIPVENARIHVFVYPLGGGTPQYAYIFMKPDGPPTTTFDTPLLTDSNGFFEFWFADKEEGGNFGYEYQREFKITWSGVGILSGSVDRVQLFDVTKREVDVTSTSNYKNRLISNLLAKGWEEHKSDTTLDHHIQYLKTNGSRFLSGDWDVGPNYGIICNLFKSRPGSALNLTNFNGVGISINANTGQVVIASNTTPAGARVFGNLVVESGGLSVTGNSQFSSNLNVGGILSTNNVAIAGGTINNARIGNLTPSDARFTSINASSISVNTASITSSLTVNGPTTLNSSLTIQSPNTFSASNVIIAGGTINNTKIGETLASTGRFTTLMCDTLITENIGGGYSYNEAGNFSAISLYSYTYTKTGSLTVSGDSVLGDGSNRKLTINGSTIDCPYGLNIGTDTLILNTATKSVHIGGQTGSKKLEVIDESQDIILRLTRDPYIKYADFTIEDGLVIKSTEYKISLEGNVLPNQENIYSLGSDLQPWKSLYVNDLNFFNSISTSAFYIKAQNGWMTIGASGEPESPIDNHFDSIRIRTTRTISAPSASGMKGEICWDSDYLYVCIDTNTWKRLELASW